MGDDLDAGRAQVAEQRLAAQIDLAADRIDRQPDLDARRDLGRQRVEEHRADVARLVTVDEQVDMIRGRRDVLEDPREVAPAVEQGVDRGRDRRREGQGQVRAPNARSRDELGGPAGGRLRADGVRVERVGRDASRAPVPAHRRASRREPGADGDRPPAAHRAMGLGVDASAMVRSPPDAGAGPGVDGGLGYRRGLL